MNTTADKLELLLRTKERQKAYLQEKYPLLDFDTIPFRSYLDLFQGRSYVPGFVGGGMGFGVGRQQQPLDHQGGQQGGEEEVPVRLLRERAGHRTVQLCLRWDERVWRVSAGHEPFQ